MRIALAATLLTLLLVTPIARAQPHGTQPGALMNPLSPAERCNECHSGGMTASGERYMAADTWPDTMMANATRDPLFLATLTDAEQDSPGLGTFCLRCHTPAGFTAGHATPGIGTALSALDGDTDGVNCDSCHRSIVPTGVTGAPFLANAELYFSDAMDAIPTRFGPRTDPATLPRHPSMGSAFIRDARMCGQCHDVNHPINHRLNADGTDTGVALALQTTYSEWAQSDFARRASPQTCQTCHMREITGETLPSTRIPGAPGRPNQRRHEFLGANAWGMNLLKAAYPDDMMDAQYDAMAARLTEFLRTTATVTIMQPPTTGVAASTVRLRVRVTNLSGHKLPTGYEDARLMWLQVQSGMRVVSGAFTGDELVEDAQARVYRFQAGRLEGGRAVHSDFVARHNTVLEDTRIPPLGMRADARTMPVGRDYSGGADGTLRNYDDATFDVQLPATTGPANITVRLMYRSTTKHYVEAIAGANHTDDRGRTLTTAWNTSQHAQPIMVAEATVTVNVTGGIDGNDASVDGGDARVDAASDAPRDASGPPPTAGACGCRVPRNAAPRTSLAGLLGLVGAIAYGRRRKTSSTSAFERAAR